MNLLYSLKNIDQISIQDLEKELEKVCDESIVGKHTGYPMHCTVCANKFYAEFYG